jgi:16S rRNA (guanine966-N2)-methyltransferase
MARHSGRIRIIGGQWARRQLPVVAVPGLRPTGDRMRETLFNWLQFELPGARVLDAFAGTGALGLEALSRGAGDVVFVEQHPQVVRQLRANLNTLDTDRGHVVQADALHYLASTPRPFDIVFVDPPFDARLQQTVVARLSAGWVKPGGWVYVEQPKKQPLPRVPEHWQLYRDKTAGQVRYLLYHTGEAE